jgi:hypothetical protein
MTTTDLLVPEIGPALGRLTAVPGARVGAHPAPRVELGDLRLAMVGRLFELAGKARASGDPAAAAALLAPDRLRQEWERGAGQVATRTLERIQSSLATAAERSGLPARRLRQLTVTAEESALLTARLRGAGVPYVDGLTSLDLAEDGSAEWADALLEAMRRLELCWLELEQRALAEELAWGSEGARIAGWRPSPWPRRVAAGAIVLILVYIGLVLGGFLPVPPGAERIASWWWTHE